MAAYERNDKHFITNYCKGKKINPKTLRNKYKMDGCQSSYNSSNWGSGWIE